MGDVSEEDSDVEMSNNENSKVAKKKYTHQTRDLSTKTKNVKMEEGDEDSEIFDENNLEEVDDEEYFKRFLNNEIEYKEDDLERQLRLEREEQERKVEAKKATEEKKTKIDPDGTEYEWDPNVKGWFPKVIFQIKVLIIYFHFRITNKK